MKLKEHTDTIAFLRRVSQCTGNVYFETDEGDLLNLRSTLSRYLFSVAICSERLAAHGRIACQNEADCALLREFMVPEAPSA